MRRAEKEQRSGEVGQGGDGTRQHSPISRQLRLSN